MKPVFMGSGHVTEKPNKKITTFLCLQVDGKPWEWGWETLSMKAGWRLLERQGPSTIDSKDQVQWHTEICLLTPAGTLPHSVREQRHTPLQSRKNLPTQVSLNHPRESKNKAKKPVGPVECPTSWHHIMMSPTKLTLGNCVIQAQI